VLRYAPKSSVVSVLVGLLPRITDPRGDTPKSLAAFLEVHGMTGQMQYLIGNRMELGHVWIDGTIVAPRSSTTFRCSNSSRPLCDA
jgi:hypothetical protein